MPRKKINTTQAGKGDDGVATNSVKINDPAAIDEAAQIINVRREPSAKATLELPAPTTSDNNIDDVETDKAVDDIMAKESDIVLAVDDILAAKQSQTTPSSTWKDKLTGLIRNKWTWVGIAVILIILFSLPVTRYKLLGLVIKEKLIITVIDSQTRTPVSNALVSLPGVSVKTDSNGTAQLKAGIGERTIVITKQYYQAKDLHYFIGFKHNPPSTIKLIATGRLVPITVSNIISGKPLQNATVHILNTTVKTNSKGQASVALPTTAPSDKASISLSGYNTKQTSVQITSQVVPTNKFSLTPSGNVYFLSDQSGTINVVKSNLDGSDQKTVLEGSGHETAATTRLIASSDWHYLVLEANRSDSGAALYLINTANNQVSEFDSSNAAFNLIGWYGHNFIYSLTHSSYNQWQSGYEVIKDYDADQAELNQLDQNQAVGNSASYAYQSFSNFFIAGSALVYDSQWTAAGGYDLSSENDAIHAYQFSSQSLKDYQSFPTGSTGSITSNHYQPQAVYFAVPSSNGTTAYYQYANQNVQPVSLTQTVFNQVAPTYLPSPSGNYVVWSALNNGQESFFKGDSNAADQQLIASLDNYSAYGWYSDSYVLASRDNDKLYILPADGLSAGRQPLLITTYYEPAASSNYEYGGF